jgi:hypothetical protein
MVRRAVESGQSAGAIPLEFVDAGKAIPPDRIATQHLRQPLFDQPEDRPVVQG